jgi:hypothetical protein
VGADGEFIGEKGIGFKSVFKAADVVFISSGPFTFKFEKSGFLGMISPIWADFPETTTTSGTSIYLQLAPDCNENALLDELENFDVLIMIFPRKIVEIKLSVSRKDGRNWDKTFSKTEKMTASHCLVTLRDRQTDHRYMVKPYVAHGLPPQTRRQNRSKAKILLAFPVVHDAQRQLPNCNVYAFLPIRSYGFKVS